MTQREALALVTKPNQAIEKKEDGSWTLLENQAPNPNTYVPMVSYHVVGCWG